jgi:hypothetical protein
MNLIADFDAWFGLDVQQFRAIFQVRPLKAGHRHLGELIPPLSDDEAIHVACSSNRNDEPVFVQDVEVMDRADSPISSVTAVRIVTANEMVRDWAPALHVSLFDLVVKPVFIPRNRELYST